MAFYIIAALDPLINNLYLAPQSPKFYLTTLVLPLLVYGVALFTILRKPAKLVRNKEAPTSVDKAKMHQIIKHMQAAKLYKNPALSLPQLSQQFGFTTNELSRLINSTLNKSFTDFINDFRIAEVQERMLKTEAEQFTLLGIALEAGFSSKTTFNRVFKERTGIAPKFYKKSAQIIIRGDALTNEG